MATSLPGICLDEKMTVSPESSLIGWLPAATRASAARSSPCPPVATISTSLRGRRIASSGEMVLGKSRRYPHAFATLMMRSSERPATHKARPVSSATSPSVWSRAALEAKVVTSTRPRALATVSIRPVRTVLSEPDASALNTLVESQTSTSTPLSPIAVSCSAEAGLPITGSASSFQSPVWKTRPAGVSISSAFASGIECDIGTNSKPNGPTLNPSPGWITRSLMRSAIRSSSSLWRMRPAVKGVA